MGNKLLMILGLSIFLNNGTDYKRMAQELYNHVQTKEPTGVEIISTLTDENSINKLISSNLSFFSPMSELYTKSEKCVGIEIGHSVVFFVDNNLNGEPEEVHYFQNINNPKKKMVVTEKYSVNMSEELFCPTRTKKETWNKFKNSYKEFLEIGYDFTFKK
ncbi:MAG: hypothetical protein ABIC91_02315 [Nanoarchaeota archaeon]|nr:hypothetical protein [Nanoarchaeota archaeon]MBU1030128.1 hypothetical protein [Nanoarchaeota archaeon]MBU1850636.1 hypothetical protein [Nanoarchaeota archaeon]